MPFADIGPVRLFYTDDGHGEPPLLLVHGYSCDSHDWSWQLPYFTPRRRVLAVDLRGHGRSSAPADGYSPSDLAGDLARLLRHLSVDEVVAVGHSLGGVVVSVLAVEHPDLVSALICVDPAYLHPDETKTYTSAACDAMKSNDPVPIVQQILSGWDAPAQHPALHTWHLRRVAGMPHHVLRRAFEGQVDGLTTYSDSAPYLARRTCPILTFSIDQTRAKLEEDLFSDRRSRTVTWEGAGHWLHQERPIEFNALVDRWLMGL